MKRVVLGITGHSGSGKSTLGHYLASEHAFTVAEGSSEIKRLATREDGQPSDRMDYDRLFRKLQERHGLDWLSRRTFEYAGNVALAGLRTRPDTLYMQKHGGLVVALICPLEVRFDRTDKANPKNAQTLDEYIRQEEAHNSQDDFGSHVQWVIDHADYHIDTSRPQREVEASVDRLLDTLAHN